MWTSGRVRGPKGNGWSKMSSAVVVQPREDSAVPAKNVSPGNGRGLVGKTASVDIAVPVYNEERSLPGCIQVLHAFLVDHFPFQWTITVVDNASTDATHQVASKLAESYSGVRVLHLDRKGRGLALRTAW